MVLTPGANNQSKSVEYVAHHKERRLNGVCGRWAVLEIQDPWDAKNLTRKAPAVNSSHIPR